MKPIARLLAIPLTVGLLTIVFAVPALGQEEGEGAVEPAQISGDLEPAVPIPVEAPVEPLPDWTYRFMVPTTLLLAAVVILITSIAYFTNVVRKRYRVVEE